MEGHLKKLPHSLASWKSWQPQANPKLVGLASGREQAELMVQKAGKIAVLEKAHCFQSQFLHAAG